MLDEIGEASSARFKSEVRDSPRDGSARHGRSIGSDSSIGRSKTQRPLFRSVMRFAAPSRSAPDWTRIPVTFGFVGRRSGRGGPYLISTRIPISLRIPLDRFRPAWPLFRPSTKGRRRAGQSRRDWEIGDRHRRIRTARARASGCPGRAGSSNAVLPPPPEARPTGIRTCDLRFRSYELGVRPRCCGRILGA